MTFLGVMFAIDTVAYLLGLSYFIYKTNAHQHMLGKGASWFAVSFTLTVLWPVSVFLMVYVHERDRRAQNTPQ